ncbi:uncharacterized protein LOC102681431 isoform X1 [Apis dorsata]|uniref:uncharacterized protein LOC102681431 isoform X1 n=1 Tax=Apis dorsata TaxID=7462 RepID=UPI0003DF728B|nr:uncharacterized protein LOC102681431 isoform X1 [Apis dorsata]XP_006621727.1 uncharacterized protein LOC102681431 isoform X1 [Apis dorsata]
MATKIKMDHIQGDIDLQIDNPLKNAANLIEWNVDMKVTVSKVKKSKMFQRFCSIVLLLLAIIFAVMLSHLRKEVRALQIQVQSLNINLLLLTSKYDRLNRSLNRVWIQRSERFLENKKLNDIKSLLEGASSISKTEIFDGIRNTTNGNLYTYNTIIPYLNSLKNFKRQHILYNTIYDTNNTTILKLFMKLENNENNASDTNLRIERATLTTEKQNLIKKISNRVKRDRDNINDSDDELNVWKESRSGRSRREERRGKKRGKNKRRPKRSHRRLGPLVATFVGAIPEQHITDTVYIGPWIKSTKNNTQYNLNKFHLVEDKKSIEVTATGLYMISAQIFYFGEPTNYSYWILLNSEGKSTTQKLVKCSTASSTSATEVSCYTSVITPLQRGDRVHIQQQERDRLINMREGHSYIQLVLLSNTICKKRLW